MGENVDLAIRNKEDKKKNYEIALKKLEDDIIKEESLSMSMPKFLGAILVEQTENTEDQDIIVTENGKKSTEMVGMNISMEYEKSEGRIPVDVSENNLGFDIKSKDNEGNIRYIEVKARSDEGLVKLTLNEWFKAKRFKKAFWLYVVVNIENNPALYAVQDPVYNLKAKQVHEISLLIYPDEWKKGEKVYEKVI